MTIDAEALVLEPCPFCDAALKRRESVNPYGRCVTPECFGGRLPIVSLDDPAMVEQWNTRAPIAIQGDESREPTELEEKPAVRDRFWLELREPGCVPQIKGPFSIQKTRSILREFFEARPTAFITVITLGYEGPELQDAPEWLEVLDGRSASVAARHRKTSKEAHARLDGAGTPQSLLDELEQARNYVQLANEDLKKLYDELQTTRETVIDECKNAVCASALTGVTATAQVAKSLAALSALYQTAEGERQSTMESEFWDRVLSSQSSPSAQARSSTPRLDGAGTPEGVFMPEEPPEELLTTMVGNHLPWRDELAAQYRLIRKCLIALSPPSQESAANGPAKSERIARGAI